MSDFTLPAKFESKIRGLLKEEAEDFFRSYERKKVQGLRMNPLKADTESFLEKNPFHLEKIPWTLEGFYYGGEDRPGKHPWHDAGVYYIQEPSAMAVVELLDPQPGDKVLDLCGAPGGKTTHIAGRLMGRGFLLSNEIHPARARILSQNVERMGIANGVVTNEDSGKLAQYFLEYFDRIVVDAPCSGEGMFRKDDKAKEEWSPDNVRLCASRQQEILENGAAMLKPGGRMVYSTCTFSPEENEGSMESFLERHPEFSLEEHLLERVAGHFSQGCPHWVAGGREDLKRTVRIWPHRVEGEGHFIAVLKKADPAPDGGREKKRRYPRYLKDKSVLDGYREFCLDTLTKEAASREIAFTGFLTLFGDQLYRLPPEMTDFERLRIVRPGLHLGTIKKNRFEPSHAYALYLREQDMLWWRDLPADGEEAANYLKGQTLSGEPGRKGWVLIGTDGYSLGWAKMAGGILKNHYPKGLRWL